MWMGKNGVMSFFLMSPNSIFLAQMGVDIVGERMEIFSRSACIIYSQTLEWKHNALRLYELGRN